MGLIVMTGATSGLGRGAAERLIATGNRVIIGARGGGAPGGSTDLRLDLAERASVNGFADRVIATLAGATIDALVLNAGGSWMGADARTVDGIEMHFGVNYLAHYLLARRLHPHVADKGRIVFTSSGTHDPSESTIIPAPRHADAQRLADPASDPERDSDPRIAGQRAYAASKLGNLMTARTLAAREDVAGRGVTVLAYDPGLTGGTGFFRAMPLPMRIAMQTMIAVTRPFDKNKNSVSAASAALAALASTVTPPPGRIYMGAARRPLYLARSL